MSVSEVPSLSEPLQYPSGYFQVLCLLSHSVIGDNIAEGTHVFHVCILCTQTN